jgi:iron complex outermembrane receptor protein
MRSLLAAAALLAALVPISAQAQDVQLAGVVRSAESTPLGAARITVTNNSTGAVRGTVTSAAGTFSLSGLPPGVYTITAARFGYRRASRADVRLPSAEAGDVSFALDPLPLQPMTVTATLREQELSEIPFSVAAPSASVLRERGAENMEAIASNVAGFSVQNLGPGQSQVAMRGASAGQIARDQPGVKPQVGVYLDDSPISLSLFTPDLDLFDVSRVEVLRGPQGTLFGAGSLSGTVRYITNQPELGVNSVFGEVSGHSIVGGGTGATAKVGMNMPVAERVAGRVAVYHNRLGGFQDAVRSNLSVDRNVNSGTRTGMRAAVRFVPNQRLSITPRVVLHQLEMRGWNRTDSFNILANPYTTARPAVTLGERRQFIAVDEPFNDDFVLSDLSVRYDFGRVNLTSITSYIWRDIVVRRDGGALFASIVGGSMGMPEPVYSLDNPFDDKTRVQAWAQEARLAGGNERARWLLGAFYSRGDRDYGQSVYVPGFEAATGMPTEGTYAGRDEVFFSDLDYRLHQSAVFGEATVRIGSRLDVTAGLRYYDFSEDRDQVFDGAFVGLISQPGSTSASGFAPRFIASFRATDRIMLNAQASRGFRLGGINDPLNLPVCTRQDSVTFSGRDSWTEETAWNYEVGAKSTWMGGRAALNLSAFHMDISDLQMTVTAGSCTSRLVYNVPRSFSQGAEVELVLAPTASLDLSLSATLNEAKVKSTLTSTDAAGIVTVVGGIEAGNRLPSVPRHQVAAAGTYRFPIRRATQGFVSAAVQHIGERHTLMEDLAPGFGSVDMQALPNTIGGPLSERFFRFAPTLPTYTIANVRLGASRASWEVALFVNNLRDTRALLALDRERGTLARVGYLTNQPRTVGVSMTFAY